VEDIRKRGNSRQEIKRLWEGTRATFEILTAVMMEAAVFWNMAQGRLVQGYQRLEEPAVSNCRIEAPKCQ
jgi:hypothetical protein